MQPGVSANGLKSRHLPTHNMGVGEEVAMLSVSETSVLCARVECLSTSVWARVPSGVAVWGSCAQVGD